MDPAKQREIASLGGKAAHAQGRAHEFTSGDEASAAGRKGGATISRNREHMREIGRLGGLRRGRGKTADKSRAIATSQPDEMIRAGEDE